jgi:hypothetical protein
VAEWKVELTGAAVQELEESLNQGPVLDDQGRRFLVEREVDRIGNLKIYIYSDEHPPPHFLVKCTEGSCRFTIADCTPLDKGLDKFLRNIKRWHKDNKQLLVDTWNESRPSDCPVGKYREP